MNLSFKRRWLNYLATSRAKVVVTWHPSVQTCFCSSSSATLIFRCESFGMRRTVISLVVQNIKKKIHFNIFFSFHAKIVASVSSYYFLLIYIFILFFFPFYCSPCDFYLIFPIINIPETIGRVTCWLSGDRRRRVDARCSHR